MRNWNTQKFCFLYIVAVRVTSFYLHDPSVHPSIHPFQKCINYHCVLDTLSDTGNTETIEHSPSSGIHVTVESLHSLGMTLHS